MISIWNSFFVSALTLVGFSTIAVGGTIPEKFQQAEKAYAQRDYNESGTLKAQEAISLYKEIVGESSDPTEKSLAWQRQAQALNFLGSASEAKEKKISYHEEGIKAAQESLLALGIPNGEKLSDADVEKIKSRSPGDQDLIAQALYHKAVNIGQWGQANGVTSSLGRWPEMRGLLEGILRIGKKTTYEHGAHRVLGRAYHKIPSVFGGDKKKAESYLSLAFNATLVAAVGVSSNGNCNLRYSEILIENDKKDKAKEILEKFVNTTPELAQAVEAPEFRDAQKNALEVLKKL